MRQVALVQAKRLLKRCKDRVRERGVLTSQLERRDDLFLPCDVAQAACHVGFSLHEMNELELNELAFPIHDALLTGARSVSQPPAPNEPHPMMETLCIFKDVMATFFCEC